MLTLAISLNATAVIVLAVIHIAAFGHLHKRVLDLEGSTAMTDPNIVQPTDGVCPLCWSPSTNAGACTDCIDHYNRLQLGDQE